VCRVCRLRAILEDMAVVLGPSRSCCVARELTKLHEEFWRGSLEEAVQEFSDRAPRGEICLVVQGTTGQEASSHAAGLSLEEAALALIGQGVSVSDASRQLAKERAVSRKQAYSVALAASLKLRE
jgi:16S rRNA (cytidine1402-2'-O)-methyltransferase